MYSDILTLFLKFTIPVKLVVIACIFIIAVSVPIFNCDELPLNKTHPPFAEVLVAKTNDVNGDALFVTALIFKVAADCDMVDDPILANALMLN